jgi:hypothetical protein
MTFSDFVDGINVGFLRFVERLGVGVAAEIETKNKIRPQQQQQGHTERRRPVIEVAELAKEHSDSLSLRVLHSETIRADLRVGLLPDGESILR